MSKFGPSVVIDEQPAIDQGSKFGPSELMPSEPTQPSERGELPTPKKYPYGTDVVLEAIAAVNRGVVDLLDLPATLVNAMSEVAGSDFRVPKIGEQEAVQEGTRGMFMEEGRPRQAVRLGGEMVAPAPPLAAAAKSIQRGFKTPAEIMEQTLKTRISEESSKLPALAGKTEQVAEEAAEAIPERIVPPNVPGARSGYDVVKAVQHGGESRDFVMDPTNPKNARFKLENGKRVNDKVAEEASKQGIDDGFISMVKTSTPETRQKYQQMVEIVKRGKADERYRKNRPWLVVGQSMSDRVKPLNDVRKQAGKELKEIVNKQLAGKQVDYTQPVDNFVADLAEDGVRIFDESGQIIRNANGEISPDFSRSIYRSSAKPKKLITDLARHLDTNNPVDAREVHIAKKYIDELVHWGKNAEGSLGAVETKAKNLRRGLDEVLDSAFPDYDRVNTTYSEIKDAFDDMAKFSGVKVRMDDPVYEKALGTGLRRLDSNAVSQAGLESAATKMDELMGKYIEAPKDSIEDQVKFATNLDGMFGTPASTSFKGQIEQPIERALESVTQQPTLTGLAVSGAKSAYKKMRDINEEAKLKALEALSLEPY